MNDANFGGAATEPFRATSNSPGADGMADQARQAAEHVLNDIKSHTSQYLEMGCGKATQLNESVEDQIRGRPVAAVAVAAGIGFALGLIWTRRS